MKTSTSIHSINADAGLPHHMKIAYLFANWINNLFPKLNVDPRIEQGRFRPQNVEGFFSEVYSRCSPSRLLSDLFWAGLDWENISQVLGGIRALDIGCGSGRYVTRLGRFSGNRIESYHGIDVYEAREWKDIAAKHPHALFSRYDGEDISFALRRCANLVITQSALEHHENDLLLFRQLAAYTRESPFPVTQIHLVPSAVCLKLISFMACTSIPRILSRGLPACLIITSSLCSIQWGGKV